MSIKRMMPAMLAFCVLLAGCRARLLQNHESSASSAEGGASASSVSSSVTLPGEVPTETKEIQGELQADLNGDGREEHILLIFEEGHLVFTVDQLRLVIPGDLDLILYTARLEAADVNGDGFQEVLVFVETCNTGATFRLHVVQLQDEALTLLPVPYLDKWNTGDSYDAGYTVEAAFEDHYKLSVYCPETGFRDQVTLDPGSWRAREYYVDGKLPEDFPPWVDYDAASRYRLIPLSNGITTLELGQAIWGWGHTDTLAFLYTMLYWEEGRPVVVNQMVIPYIDGRSFRDLY